MKPRVPVLLLALGVLAVPAPAQASTNPCDASDITVIVQYGDGPTQVGCAKGDPDSGYAALQSAGFTIIQAQGTGHGAICRINGYPSGNNCGAMPPADAYWAYFHGTSSGTWNYSDMGGAAYDPKPGSVEGWRFKGSPTDPPDLAPPAPSTGTPTARPTTRTSPTARANGPTPSSGGAGTTDSSGPTTAGPLPTSPSVPGRSKGSTSTPSGGASDSVPPTAYSAPGPVGTEQGHQDDSSGGRSWIWGLALIAVLAAAGGATAVIRRRV